MKKVFVFVTLCAFIFPAITHAVWWNPRTWKTTKQGTTTASSVTQAVSESTYKPSVEELLKRIAELETKLDEAREKLKVVEAVKTAIEEIKVAPKAVVQAPVISNVSSDKEILAKVKGAIVSVETATSSGSGVVIDSKGHILVPAHTIWATDGTGAVVGATEEMKVIFSSGTEKKARLVGLDEIHDTAIIQLVDKSASTYVKLSYDSSVKVGDKAYVFGLSGSKDGVIGGSAFVSGTISKKGTGLVEITSDSKPLDNGGPMINASGGVIGLSNKSVCKVLEEMKTCLKYTITANITKDSIAKLLDGMRLYRNKKYSTATEELVRGQLQGIRTITQEGVVIEYVLTSFTGKNSFDFLNEKLRNDDDGRVMKLYLQKLKSGAEGISNAMDFFKNQANTLNLFLINESSNIEKLGDYQRKIIAKIQADNIVKLKEYQAKVSFWSAKKNEYDALLVNLSNARIDYLTTEGLSIEKAAAYLKSEQQKILDIFSGETIDIF